MSELRERIIIILDSPLKTPWMGDAEATIRQGIENQADQIRAAIAEQGLVRLPSEKEIADKLEAFDQGEVYSRLRLRLPRNIYLARRLYRWLREREQGE